MIEKHLRKCFSPSHQTTLLTLPVKKKEKTYPLVNSQNLCCITEQKTIALFLSFFSGRPLNL